MRAVVQRVRSAKVEVDGEAVGAIRRGLLVLLAAGKDDTDADCAYCVNKILGLRIFSDDGGKMNLSVAEVGGALLVVSQFTLYGDVRKGFRPGFSDAMEPARAEAMVDAFVEGARAKGLAVETGKFRADMLVSLENEGPVTILVDSKKTF